MIESAKISWISGLKGVACLAVVNIHLLACLMPEAQNGSVQNISALDGVYNFIQLTPINIVFNGSFFVFVFWTLSAYLMVVSNRNEQNHLVVKLVRKFLRIFSVVFIVSTCFYLFIAVNP